VVEPQPVAPDSKVEPEPQVIAAAPPRLLIFERIQHTVRGMFGEPAAPSMFTERGTPAGSAPDYALTGDYWPTNYWPVYWPMYGAPAATGGGRLLGGGMMTAGRGLS
jgi:hypothetical protein